MQIFKVAMPTAHAALAFFILFGGTFVFSNAAKATAVITDDRGGYLESYRARYANLRASGETVVVDGDCLSACTLVLAMMPPERVCVTQRAIVGFHAVRYQRLSGTVLSGSATARLVQSYPSRLQNWIERNGGLGDELILLTGKELTRMYPGQYRNCRA